MDGQAGLFRIVRDRDVAPEAYRDVFTAVLKRPAWACSRRPTRRRVADAGV
jgi:hypothetical protein